MRKSIIPYFGICALDIAFFRQSSQNGLIVKMFAEWQPNLSLIIVSTEPTVLIGRCSTQTFASSAYTCQRKMMTNLAKEDSGSCRWESSFYT